MVEFWRYSSRNRVGHQRHPLTAARRSLVLELWSAGMTKEEIACSMFIDEDTVSRHLREARRAGDARAVVRHPYSALALATVRLTGRQATEIVGNVMEAQARRGVVYAQGTLERAISAAMAVTGVDAVTNAIDVALCAGIENGALQ